MSLAKKLFIYKLKHNFNKYKKTSLFFLLCIIFVIIVEILIQVVFAGRHFNVMMFVTTQDVKGLPPNFHQNADLVATSFSTQKRQLDVLEENYAFLFTKDKDTGISFLDLIKDYTVDHGFIVVDRSEAKYTLQEMFYQSKAELEVKKFKIGSDKFWKDAQCSWKRQLEMYKNQKKKESLSKKRWLKISLKQLRKEKLKPDEKEAI